MLRLIDRAAIGWMNWRRMRRIKNDPGLEDFRVTDVVMSENHIDIGVKSGAVPFIANELARCLIAHDAKTMSKWT